MARMGEFQPYIHPRERPQEFTLRSALAGALAGIIFGSANAYLGLKVGLTISTSIPIAVIAVAILKASRNKSILEANMIQTIGSASSSLASGLIFTVPALFLWGMPPSIAQMTLWGGAGGLLGCLFMILLRRPLIVKEHDTLPYPEGTACAAVLKAADKGGVGAKPVFWGMGIGALLQFFTSFLKLYPTKISLTLPILPKGEIGLVTSPALLAVGFILNYRISAIIVSGGLLAAVLIIPMLAYLGGMANVPIPPITDQLMGSLSAKDIWHNYVRFIGAGAVASAGIITVVRGLPMMIESFGKGFESLKMSRAMRAKQARTDQDLSMKWILALTTGIILVLALVPGLLGDLSYGPARFVAALAIAIFAFLFVTVSSRIVGMVGVSSNPTSGMTIVTLLGTSLVFASLGWTDAAGRATALIVGCVVAVAASIAGDTSQDLKTGYLLGATPYRQQVGELLGVVSSCTFIAAAIWMLGQTYTFGSEALPAPQATLMKTVIDGVLQANLPWELVMLGVGITVVAELIGIPSLPFAVGVYLPVYILTPIFVGGCLRRFVESRRAAKHQRQDDEASAGILLSSGLIAGEGLFGICIATYAFTFGLPQGLGLAFSSGTIGYVLTTAIFVALAIGLVRVAQKR